MALGLWCSGIRLLPEWRWPSLREPFGSEPLLVIPGIRPEGAAMWRSAAGGYSRGRDGFRSKLPGGRAADYPGC